MADQHNIVSLFNDFIETSNAVRWRKCSDAIWDHPETRFAESFSSALLACALEASGFSR